MRFFRKIISISLLIVWSLFMTFMFLVVRCLPWFDEQKLPVIFHKGICKIAGLKVKISGSVANSSPILFVSNHISYLDIFVMGQYIPAYFVAKSEVATWPVLNRFAKFQNTIFIERKSSKAKQQTRSIQDELAQSRNIILFPEGTSTNGAEVKAFKSSLFAVAETDRFDLIIQPVSISYTKHAGKGMSQEIRDNFAWYADMPFGKHFLNVLSLSSVEVELKYHPPVRLDDFDDRKKLALDCELTVRQGLESSLADSGSTLT